VADIGSQEYPEWLMTMVECIIVPHVEIIESWYVFAIGVFFGTSWACEHGKRLKCGARMQGRHHSKLHYGRVCN